MAGMLPSRLPPVLPCVAYNQSSCLSENCGFSHLADSFSLGSGGRNVCLLFLMDRCDGWGCSYSHCRTDLEWTDDEIKFLVHHQLQLIDAYNGRMSRNSYSKQPFTTGNHTLGWVPVAAPQPYPTPPASSNIDSAPFDAAILENEETLRGNAITEEIMKLSEHQPVDSVSPEDEIDEELARMESDAQTHSQDDTDWPPALNPYATPFIPLGVAPVAAAIEETQDEAWGPGEYPAAYEQVTSAFNNDYEIAPPDEEEVNSEKTASKEDIDGWGSTPEQTYSWDDMPSGGWDGPPPEDAFKTPPKTTSSWSPPPAQKEFETTSKGKGKARETRRKAKEAKTAEPAATQPKGKPESKKPNKHDKASSRKQEQRQNTPSTSKATKQEKPRPAVVVSLGESSTAFASRKNEPHQTLESAVEEQAKNYKMTLEPGSIIPHDEKLKEIIKENLIVNEQLAQVQAASAQGSPSQETTPEVDSGMQWVNGGASRFKAKPDAPRSFAQRSGASGSTWGSKNFPPLNGKK